MSWLSNLAHHQPRRVLVSDSSHPQTVGVTAWRSIDHALLAGQQDMTNGGFLEIDL